MKNFTAFWALESERIEQIDQANRQRVVSDPLWRARRGFAFAGRDAGIARARRRRPAFGRRVSSNTPQRWPSAPPDGAERADRANGLN
jgi:hypothetical protein